MDHFVTKHEYCVGGLEFTSGQQILGFYLFEKNILFGDQLYYVHTDEISFHCRTFI